MYSSKIQTINVFKSTKIKHIIIKILVYVDIFATQIYINPVRKPLTFKHWVEYIQRYISEETLI